MGVFRHTRLNRLLRSTASPTASPEAADCVLLFLVRISPSPSPNMAKAGTAAVFLALCLWPLPQHGQPWTLTRGREVKAGVTEEPADTQEVKGPQGVSEWSCMLPVLGHVCPQH